MDYNTGSNKLILPEYGRNIQRLVEQALEIEDRKERTDFSFKIIELMGNMYPYLRDLRDFKHKIWDHLIILSDYRLDIDSPYETPTKETFSTYPENVPYSDKRIRYKYYGKTISALARKIVEMEEGEDKITLIGLTANHMKKMYLSWNKDQVDDSTIFRHLIELSGNKDLKIPENIRLSDFRNLHTKKRKIKKR